MRFLSISGRMGRRQYFLHNFSSFLILMLLILFAAYIEENISKAAGKIFYNLAAVYLIIYFVSGISASIRRLHDLDRGGSGAFLLFIPLINFIFGLQLLFEKGTDGPNKYGDDPLEKTKQNAHSGILSQYVKKNSKAVYGTMVIAAALTLLITIYKNILKDEKSTLDISDNYKIPEQPSIFSASESSETHKQSDIAVAATEQYIISYEILHKLLANLYEESLVTSKMIDITADSAIHTLTFSKGEQGIIITMETYPLVDEYERRLLEFGFRKAHLSRTDKKERYKLMEYKEYYLNQEVIHMQIGTDFNSILYFVNYILKNFYLLEDRKNLTVNLR